MVSTIKYTSAMVAAVTPFTGKASQLRDLHRKSLARFETVTLTQWLVNGRKTLLRFTDMDNARRRKRTRNAKKEG